MSSLRFGARSGDRRLQCDQERASPRPWEEDADRENRTVWADRDGIAERMLEAIEEEIRQRGLR